jgi:hypothetical protein
MVQRLDHEIIFSWVQTGYGADFGSYILCVLGEFFCGLIILHVFDYAAS